MTERQLQTPVVLTIFNRPDSTKKVFESIREAKPPKLLIIADAPRADRPNEEEKCAAARACVEQVDWDCEVLKNYSLVNLGPIKRITSGLDWVFNTVEEAIILEHDCVPDITFFCFCQELLEYYKHDERVMSICGQNIQFGRKRTEYSYYFSRYYHSWGWATWKRAWQYYDLQMKLWPEVRDKGLLKNILGDSRAVKYWTRFFQASYAEQLNSWDYQWTFACWIQNGLTILPDRNLVSNIGFVPDAVNTTDVDSHYANMPIEPMNFPLKHPPFIIANLEADRFTQNTAFDPNLMARLKAKFNRSVGKKYI
jgi:hypothetical protein